MRNDLVDLTVVVDRSGSMAVCKNDAQGGVNNFISEQKNQIGECLLSLVQFDTEYEFVHKAKPIKDVGSYTLNPRGATALLDAVGRAINETGERLKNMDESQRPGLVIFVIVTDGEENSSHEFNKTQIKEMIERQQSQYKWQFTFLGANQDAFHEAGAIGIAATAAANFNPQNAQQAYRAASSNVSRMRKASLAGDAVMCSYTDEERVSMKE